jgi:hypothetical protein
MQIKTIFRGIILIYIASMAANITLSIMLDDMLPVELYNYLAEVENKPVTNLDYFVLFILMVFYPLSLIGIWLFNAWGRTLFVAMEVLGILIFPIIIGHVVMNPWEALFYEISGMLSGIIIAMLFIGPVGDKFNKTVHQKEH